MAGGGDIGVWREHANAEGVRFLRGAQHANATARDCAAIYASLGAAAPPSISASAAALAAAGGHPFRFLPAADLSILDEHMRAALIAHADTAHAAAPAMDLKPALTEPELVSLIGAAPVERLLWTFGTT